MRLRDGGVYQSKFMPLRHDDYNYSHLMIVCQYYAQNCWGHPIVPFFLLNSWGVSMGRRYGEIYIYFYGWMNYFGIGMKYNDAVEFDHWLRRRIRMCYLKQWRRARKRISELIKLGSPKYQAILTGLSRKGY
ncbi:MAG: group II intron maturase-specific domain-containing protein [Nitrospirota bacterium]